MATIQMQESTSTTGQFNTARNGVIPATSNPVEVLAVTPVADAIIDPGDVLQFDVRSLTAITRIVVAYKFDGYKFREVAYEGVPAALLNADFEEIYSPRSTIQVITDGLFFRYRFRMLREPKWPNSPQLSVMAYNSDGLEA